MMLINMMLYVVITIIAIAMIIYYLCKREKQNNIEECDVNDLKRRIEELDNENIEVDTIKGNAKIIVPDIVDPEESTIKSTQKDECKEYTVFSNSKMRKKVIGSKKDEEIFVNNEIKRVEDKSDNPIQENESFLSKILNSKKDEE